MAWLVDVMQSKKIYSSTKMMSKVNLFFSGSDPLSGACFFEFTERDRERLQEFT